MPAGYNLIGQRFNRLTVIEAEENDKFGNKRWKCLCDCGNYTSVTSSRLVKGKIKSCGCLAKENIAALNYKDITNQTFNRLTARYKVYKSSSNGQYYWYCDCICGNHKIIRGDSLRDGSVKSCGCLQAEMRINNLSGQVIGSLQFIEPTEQRQYGYVIWHCRCLKCNNDCYISTREIELGKQTCGCDRICRSLGEQKIINLLSDANIEYIKEYTKHSCYYSESGKIARFDFYIPNQNYIIEYDGIQHTVVGNGPYDNPKKFAETQSHDNQKNQWCRENNIPLIRIPYWHYNKLCLEDLQLDTTNFLI